MSEQIFKQGDFVVFVDETGRYRRQVEHVTATGIVVLSGERMRFRQDGSATNNMGRERIERLSTESAVSEQMTVYAVFGDMENDVPDAYVLTEAAAKHMLQGSEIGDFIAMDITMDQWMNFLTPKPVETE